MKSAKAHDLANGIFEQFGSYLGHVLDKVKFKVKVRECDFLNQQKLTIWLRVVLNNLGQILVIFWTRSNSRSSSGNVIFGISKSSRSC